MNAVAVKRGIVVLLCAGASMILLAYVDGGRENPRLIEQPVELPPASSWDRVS